MPTSTCCITMSKIEHRSRGSPYNDDVDLCPAQFVVFALQVDAYRLHLFGGEALVGRSKIELVDHSLADVDAYDRLDVWA